MITSSSRFVVEGVYRESGVVHSFKMVDPVLFVFGSHVLYSRAHKRKTHFLVVSQISVYLPDN